MTGELITFAVRFAIITGVGSLAFLAVRIAYVEHREAVRRRQCAANLRRAVQMYRANVVRVDAVRRDG